MLNKQESVEKAQEEIQKTLEKYNCVLVPILTVSEFGTKGQIRLISKDETKSGQENQE